MTSVYRRNVGIVVYNQDGKVLWCERNDLPGQWQFPQGGIEAGESFMQAAKRELKEETSIVSVTPAACISEPLCYDFPPEVAERFNKKGQAMNWVLYRFWGDESEINLQTEHPEFVNCKWVDIDETPQNIVQFKRDVYKKMTAVFKPYISGDTDYESR